MPSSAARIFTHVRAALRDQAEAVARLLPEPDAHPVADVEPLGLDPLVVEDDAAVGQHAVDVGEDQFDGLAALFEVHGVGHAACNSGGS